MHYFLPLLFYYPPPPIQNRFIYIMNILRIKGSGWSDNLHPTRLTDDEQYSHMSLWALLAAPLIIGCDISQLDNTKSILQQRFFLIKYTLHF